MLTLLIATVLLINYGQAGEDAFDNELIGNMLADLILKSF